VSLHFSSLPQPRRCIGLDPLALLATDPMLTTRTSAPPPAPPLLSPKARRRLGWTAGAAGAVQMGVAGIFGLRAFDKRQQSDDLCPGGACASQQGADLNDQAGTAADVSTILVVTGLATLAAAVYLLMTSPKGAGDRT